MRRFLLPALGLLLVAPNPILACLWDSDTLFAEARGLPGVVEVIVGRFERNPPLYYEMRLNRVVEELESDPGKLDAYDDAGVACDRLGRDDEAITWMDRKREALERFEAAGLETRDHWYRYHANLGTFRVHRWLRAGADRDRLDEVRQARDEIARAIEINPDAHFGREKYQLKALEWIIDPPAVDPDKPLPGFLDLDPDAISPLPEGSSGAARGISGLIVLGSAWESVDALHTLGQVLQRDGDRTSLAYLARLRCDELIDQGRGSLLPGSPRGEMLKSRLYDPTQYRLQENLQPIVRAEFARRRAEADSWHKARTAYMMTRLDAGRHPDTDPTFWDGYSDPGPPPLPRSRPLVTWLYSPASHFPMIWAFFVALVLIGVVVLAVLALILLVLQRGHRRKPAPLDPDGAEPGAPELVPWHEPNHTDAAV